MPLQDLTPQLRTRLNRMEKAVGWFVFLAAALLIFGFGFYIYHTAERKGWFKIKAPFHIYVKSSSGLNIGDPVVMMGFPVGQITRIHAMPPRDPDNVRIDFEVKDDYFRYLWSGGSFAKINSGLLGTSQLEVTRGTNGYELVVTQPVSLHSLDEAKSLMLSAPDHWQLSQDVLDVNSNLLFCAYERLEYVFDPTNAPVLAVANLVSNSIYIYDNQVNRDRIVASWDTRYRHYKIFSPGHDSAWMPTVEPPAIADQLSAIVGQVQAALPGILALTNKISTVLDNAANATSNLNLTLIAAQPVLTNVAVITGELREPGSPLIWALGANGNSQIQGGLTNLNSLLVNTDTNLGALLINLSDITGELSSQIRGNTNLVGGIYKTIMDADDMLQGLKRHWLLRSAFKTNQPPTGKK
jgi:ABC-type transporter Mla subunit MlaD